MTTFGKVEVFASSDPGIQTPSFIAEGPIGEVVVGETVAAGNFLYLDATANEWKIADAKAASDGGKAPALCMALEAGVDGGTIKVALPGCVITGHTVAVGEPVWLNDTTAGGVQAAVPTTTDETIQILGVSLAANKFLFIPEYEFTQVS